MLGLLVACAADGPRGSEAAPSAVEARKIDTASAPLRSRQRFFSVTRDGRRCASPLCGGYFVQAVNQTATVCADGSQAERCYVASIDWQELGGDPQPESATFVVEGVINPQEYPDFGNLGVLVAVGAWAPPSGDPAAGEFFRLADNGIRCITEPCFSIDAERLNRGTVIALSGLDLSLVDATPEQFELAYQALSQGTLIASGRVRSVRGMAGIGRELVASQFFVPARARCFSDDDCSEDERCNAGEVCLPPPGCLPGAGCPTVCSGFCVPRADETCQVDEDCPGGTWCRQREDGGMECVPFVGEGASCNGFTLPWSYERCAPELTCDTPPFIADAPGICRASCETSSDCTPEQYCASDSLCHADGSCDFSVDCNLDGNSYAHIECVGYGVCPEFENQCGWQCGTPACLDLIGYDFGPCDAVLGVGVLDGECTTISGCDANGFALFASQAECDATCNP